MIIIDEKNKNWPYVMFMCTNHYSIGENNDTPNLDKQTQVNLITTHMGMNHLTASRIHQLSYPLNTKVLYIR